MKTISAGTAALVLLAIMGGFVSAETGPTDNARTQSSDAAPGHLKMALISMKCLVSDTSDPGVNRKSIQANLDRHLFFIDQAAAQGAEFIGFPELSINGYHFSPTMTWLNLDGPEVKLLAQKAVEKGVYISAGIAELDAAGKKWNTQFVLGPDGKLIGWHHKIWLTAEKGHVEPGTDHNVFEVKGVKMGISICADGSDYFNLKALADQGARIIYGPHANTTGSTLAGWYKFRSKWSGAWDGTYAKARTSNDGPEADMPSSGWCAQLKVYGALHNHAGLYHPEFHPPMGQDSPTGWAGGAWFIAPDGATLAQIPVSSRKEDSKESILIYSVPTR